MKEKKNTKKLLKDRLAGRYSNGNSLGENMIYLTTGHCCNENCVFCIMKGNEHKFPEMSFKKVKSIIKSFLEDGGKSIAMTGGEPTLRDDLPKIIEWAENFKALDSIAIITNGVRLSDKDYALKVIKADKRNKLSFCFSLHSHKKDISEKITRSSGTFDKTIEGLRNICQTNKLVSIYQVITVDNYRDLTDFCRFLKENFPQIKHITFAYPFPQGDALKNKWIYVNLRELKPYLLEALYFLEENNYDISIAACGQFPLCVISGFEEKLINPLLLAEKNIIGTVGRKVFNEYMYGSKKFVDEYKNKSKECAKCLLNNYCQGFFREYIDIFGFDGIEQVTVENFSGKKINSTLLDDRDFENIIKELSYKKLNLILLNKYSDNHLLRLFNFIKENEILGLVETSKRPISTSRQSPALTSKQLSPTKLIIMTGFSCNNNCSICSVKPKAKNHPDRTTEEIKKDLINGRKKKYERVDITGGEPTIRADILELIKLAKDLGYKEVEIGTNARMFSYDDFCQKVVENGLDGITLTINADISSIGDAICRTPGAFNQAIQGVKNILKYPQVSISASTVVIRLNYNRLPQIGKLIHSLGIKRWYIADLIPDGNAREFYGLLSVNILELANNLNNLRKIVEKFDLVVFFDFPLCLFSSKMINNPRISFINAQRRTEEFKQVGYKPKRFDKSADEFYGDIHKQRVEVCHQCKFCKNCGGIWLDYLELYGRERGEKELFNLAQKNRCLIN